MVVAADWAITAARRAASYGERGRVTVEDVQARMYDDFRVAAVPRDVAGDVLRERFELRAGYFDLDTDAYDDIPEET
ncbi:hypothetical protein [Streptomyces sp. NPDC088733]|uniref:hypothetical protein n=1 Tax=Streptomyces sp. NPDC088733 TaxID=3365880 RepID=UPI0038048C1C